MSSDSLPEITDFPRHVVLYAKNWYGVSKDVAPEINYLHDLGELLKVYAGIDYVNSYQLYDFVVHTFCRYVSWRNQREAIVRLWRWKSPEDSLITMNEVVESMIVMIAGIKIEDEYLLDMNLLNIRFGNKKQT